MSEETYYTPVGDNVSFVPAKQSMYVDLMYKAPTFVGFKWGLANVDPAFSGLDTRICILGAAVKPNSVVVQDENTVIMEYNNSSLAVGRGLLGNLGCYFSQFSVGRNQTRLNGLE